MRAKSSETRGRYKRCTRCQAMLGLNAEFCPHCGLHMPMSFPHNPMVAADAKRTMREVMDGTAAPAPWVTAGRYLVIVGRDRNDLFEYFGKIFIYDLNVRVVQDRRVAERRGRPASATPERTPQTPKERRSRDRRRKALAGEIDRLGFAIVRLA